MERKVDPMDTIADARSLVIRQMVTHCRAEVIEALELDYEAATQAYLDTDMHGDLDLIALCARQVVHAALRQ